MSAALSGIGPVSVRYAAQIRDLLYAQAVKRMAADAETARAQAEADRAARLDAIAKAGETKEPVKVDIPQQEKVDAKIERAKLAEPVKQPEAKAADPAPAPQPTAQFVDELV